MNKLKLCLVGVGSIGRRHLRLLNERDDVTLSVVEPFEPSWQRIVDEVGTFERFASLDEALAAGNIDAVIISTPTVCMPRWPSRLWKPVCMCSAKSP